MTPHFLPKYIQHDVDFNSTSFQYHFPQRKHACVPKALLLLFCLPGTPFNTASLPQALKRSSNRAPTVGRPSRATRK